MFTILDSKIDKDKWLQEIEKTETKNYDLFLDPDFVNANLQNSHSLGKLIVYKNMNKYFLHCFQLNKIIIKDFIIEKKNYFDISTPTGYSGSISNISDNVELSKFRALYRNFIKKNNIIAELIKINPLENNFKSPTANNKKFMKLTCSIDLTINDNQMFKSKQKNMISSAKSRGLSAEISFDKKFINKFKNMYHSFLKKKNADKRYYLNSDLINFIKKKLEKKDAFFVNVLDINNNIITTGLFSLSNNLFHYLYSASLDSKKNRGSFNLMMKCAYDYGKKNKIKKIFLGGGKTSSKEDNLFKFKKRISDDTHKFFVIENIYNMKIYNLIKNIFLKNKNNFNKEKLIFYR